MKQTINVSSKAEIKAAVTSQFCKGCFNYFVGDIRNGNRYTKVSYYHTNNKLQIQVTYWQDGETTALERASLCSSASGLTNKVAKFLNLK